MIVHILSDGIKKLGLERQVLAVSADVIEYLLTLAHPIYCRERRVRAPMHTGS